MTAAPPRARLGQPVLVRVSPASNSGSDVAAAVIVRVGESDLFGGVPAQLVNLIVLLDNSCTEWRKQVPLYETEALARAHPPGPAAWWPVLD